MAQTQLATRIDSRVKKAIEKLEELADIADINRIRRERTRPLADVIRDLGLGPVNKIPLA